MLDGRNERKKEEEEKRKRETGRKSIVREEIMFHSAALREHTYCAKSLSMCATEVLLDLFVPLHRGKKNVHTLL